MYLQCPFSKIVPVSIDAKTVVSTIYFLFQLPRLVGCVVMLSWCCLFLVFGHSCGVPISMHVTRPKL